MMGKNDEKNAVSLVERNNAFLGLYAYASVI